MQGLPPHLTPRTDAGRVGLAAVIERPAGALVALDYDGTLAPIVDDPAAARPYPGALDVLARTAATVGALAVVTGRPAAAVVELAGLARAPGLGRLVVFGLYGAQRWDAATGHLDAAPDHPGVADARRELPGVLADVGPPAGGCAIEDKGQALAVHTRRAADPEAALAALGDALRPLAVRLGLRLEPGRYVLELRPPEADKGRTLTSYAAECAASAVLYAGDDLGDLAAFDAVADLRGRGVPGLAVAVSSPRAAAERAGTGGILGGRDPLAARADLVVPGPGELLALLAALAEEAR